MTCACRVCFDIHMTTSSAYQIGQTVRFDSYRTGVIVKISATRVTLKLEGDDRTRTIGYKGLAEMNPVSV